MAGNKNGEGSSEWNRSKDEFKEKIEINPDNRDRKDKLAKKHFENKDTSGINPFAAWSGFKISRSSRNPFNFVQADIHEDHSDAISKVERKAENGHATKNGKGENQELKVSGVEQTVNSSASKIRKPLPYIDHFSQLQNLNDSFVKSRQLHPPNIKSSFQQEFLFTNLNGEKRKRARSCEYHKQLHTRNDLSKSEIRFQQDYIFTKYYPLSSVTMTEEEQNDELKSTGTGVNSSSNFRSGEKRKRARSCEYLKQHHMFNDLSNNDSNFQPEFVIAKENNLSTGIMTEEGKNFELQTTDVSSSSNFSFGGKRKWARSSEYHLQHLTINDPSKNKSSFPQEFVFTKEGLLLSNANCEDIANYIFSSACSSNEEDKIEYGSTFEPVATISTFNFNMKEALKSSISPGCSTGFKDVSVSEKESFQFPFLSNSEENLPLEKGRVQVPTEHNSTQQLYSRGLLSKPFPHSLSFLPLPFRFHLFQIFQSENSQF